MFYHLLYPLREIFFGFNVFGYISFRAVGAALTALIISFLFGPRIIRILQSRQIGETIRQDGPKSHLKKEGTPTMGGIIVLLAIILPTILWARLDNKFILLMLFSTLWMGLIGFVDDYMKIKLKKSKGLIARYKLLGQISLGFIISYFLFKIDINNYFLVNTDTSVNALAMPLIGGTATWLGPVLGAVVLGTLQQIATVTISSEINLLIVGLFLVGFVIFAPDGFLGLIKKFRNRGD